VKLPDLSSDAIMYAAIMKQQYDDNGDAEIYKSTVGTDESVYSELKKAHIICDSQQSDFVTFLPEGYEAWIRRQLHRL